ncbi:MAG: hypothetical protein JNL67_16855 [Planctomycetaceae bacterium]|nr:hypothetical protein [Planctomycetaceae bacterium]
MATVSSQPRPKTPNRTAAPVNPYQAPVATPPTRKAASPVATRPATNVPALHSERAIGVSTFLGGAIAGAILVARNQMLLGRKTQAITFLLATMVWQAILIAVSLALPFEVPGGVWMGVSVAHALLFQQIAKHLFAQPYAQIAEGRGQWASWGIAAAAVVVTMIGVGSIAVALAMCL